MKIKRLGLSQKILAGFFVLIALVTVNAIMSIRTLRTSAELVKNNLEVRVPSLEALEAFGHLATRLRMLTTNWAYVADSHEDHRQLQHLLEVEYPTQKARLQALATKWESPAEQQQLSAVFATFDTAASVSQEVMLTLQSFDDYEDFFKRSLAEERIATELVPAVGRQNQYLHQLLTAQRQRLQRSNVEISGSFNWLRTVLVVITLIFFVVGLSSAGLTARMIARPIRELRDVIARLGRGELPEHTSQHRRRRDEIGEIALAVDQLVTGLRQTSAFAREIGSGNLEAEFRMLSEQDVLGNALLEMRSSLQAVKAEETARQWATEGITQFNDVLRSHHAQVSDLADTVIRQLVKYVGANQGALFIREVATDAQAEDALVLTACYAWDRKKHLRKRLEMGEGLAGQAWREGNTILLTDVPDNYLQITSGLGKALPKCVLIVPMRVNEETFGVIEMASFSTFAPHQIQFIERVGENIAATVSGAIVSQRTAHLLEASQQQAEELRAQEEEMRQNLEELQATQEHQQHLQEELRQSEAALRGKLDELEAARREIEKVKEAEERRTNERLEAQKKTMTHVVEKFRQQEAELRAQLAEKENELAGLRSPTA